MNNSSPSLSSENMATAIPRGLTTVDLTDSKMGYSQSTTGTLPSTIWRSVSTSYPPPQLEEDGQQKLSQGRRSESTSNLVNI